MSRLRPQRSIGNNRALALFESLAASTWDWLGHARSLRLGFSEDTVSDLTALEIARPAPSEVGIGRVSKIKERFVGFDWLWIINRPRGRHAIYVIQAKKVRIDQSTGYSYGRRKYPNSPPYQIDVLQDFASHIGAVSSGPHHQDSGEAKIRESTAGVSRKPSSDGKARGSSSKHLCGLTAWNT